MSEMELCPKCGCLAFFNSYFNKMMCNTCEHTWKIEDTREKAIQLIDAERNRQDIKWGEQNHPPQFWTGILGEEYGEYCQAVNETVFSDGEVARPKGGYDNMLTELTHVAAVAVGAMESLMRNKGESK